MATVAGFPVGSLLRDWRAISARGDDFARQRVQDLTVLDDELAVHDDLMDPRGVLWMSMKPGET